MALSEVSFCGDESGSHGDGPFVLGGYWAVAHRCRPGEGFKAISGVFQPYRILVSLPQQQLAPIEIIC